MLKLALIAPANYFSHPLQAMAQYGVVINVVLMVLNLFPIPPLDGGRIAVSLLPNRLAYRFAMIEPYGLIIIVAAAVHAGPRRRHWAHQWLCAVT